jgi:hypothetical protein
VDSPERSFAAIRKTMVQGWVVSLEEGLVRFTKNRGLELVVDSYSSKGASFQHVELAS